MLTSISAPSALLSTSQTLELSQKDVAEHAALSISAPSLPSAAEPPAPDGGAPAAPADADEPYYWEAPAGGEAPPLPVVLIHNVHYLFSRAFATAEYVGDFFAEFFGLYNSRYEWAAELERRQLAAAEEAEHLEARRQRWEEATRLNGGRPVVGVPVAAAPAAAAAPPPSAAKEDGGDEQAGSVV
jgi:hypothetical protein